MVCLHYRIISFGRSPTRVQSSKRGSPELVISRYHNMPCHARSDTKSLLGTKERRNKGIKEPRNEGTKEPRPRKRNVNGQDHSPCIMRRICTFTVEKATRHGTRHQTQRTMQTLANHSLPPAHDRSWEGKTLVDHREESLEHGREEKEEGMVGRICDRTFYSTLQIVTKSGFDCFSILISITTCRRTIKLRLGVQPRSRRNQSSDSERSLIGKETR